MDPFSSSRWSVFTALSLFPVVFLSADEVDNLRAELEALRAENAALRQQLAEQEAETESISSELARQETVVESLRSEQREERREQRQGAGRDRGPGGGIEIGPFSVGGGMRVAYTLGDYSNPETEANLQGPSRAGNGGTVYLDTFYLSAEFERDDWIGAAEYRFYDTLSGFGGYHFLHTAWAGYRFNDGGEVKLGVQEVPFGLDRFGAAYGFFNSLDYVVGLTDDRDLGLTYAFSWRDFEFDLGYFLQAEPRGFGESRDSARGSFDVVSPAGFPGVSSALTGVIGNNLLGGNFSPFRERHQMNLRAKYNLYLGATENVLGASIQYGQLEETDPLDRVEDGEMWATNLFAQSTFGNWQIKGSLTYYHYDLDEAVSPLLGYNPDHIVLGGFDLPFYVASEGVIPSVGISYTVFTRNLRWLDYFVPFVDYSAILKQGSTNGQYFFQLPLETDFRDSQQLSIGSIFVRGQWLVYAEMLLGKGAPLIGNENDQLFSGASLNQGVSLTAPFDPGWQARFNVNFGYYF
jgi:hypothetical protein